jgi:hypothetical protein
VSVSIVCLSPWCGLIGGLYGCVGPMRLMECEGVRWRGENEISVW